METRVAVLAIIVREGSFVQPLNELLHEYGQYIIGRMGGDEFAVLLIGQAEGDVLRTAECILEAIRAPFPLQEGEARISSSVGVAFHSLEAATPARLLKNADVAMYRAKGEGRDRLWRYRPSTFTDSGYGRVF